MHKERNALSLLLVLSAALLTATSVCQAAERDTQNSPMTAQQILETADERIERHRKGDVTLELRLPDGKPLEPGVSVEIEQTRHAFLFGCNVFKLNGFEQAEENKAYAEQFADLFNFATLPFYWWSYESTQGRPQYEKSERIIHWCKDNNIVPKGHPLAWNWADPSWLPDDTDKVMALQFDRIEQCVQRFKGSIEVWDVVNEATHYDRESVSQRAPKLTKGIQTMGRAPYLHKAFETARQANPDAVLLINDYRTDTLFEQRVLAELVDEHKEPLYDVIGIQSHMHGRYWGAERTWEVLERYAQYGKPLHFTELTILSGALKGKEAPSPWPSTPEGEERQAKQVAEFYTVLFSHPSVEAITWWDFSDKGAWQGAPAGLVRKDLSPKPAYDELKRLIKDEWWTTTNVRTAEDGGAVTFRGFYGDYVATVDVDGRSYRATFTLARDTTSLGKVELE